MSAARELGWQVERTAAAFASSDGRGRISIGVDEVLDVDDAVAQLVFHELCHGLVQGPALWAVEDWGLSNADDRDVVAEHACLRVQAHLAARHGLRSLLAPTTEYRPYHDALGDQPLLPMEDAAADRARRALERRESMRWIAIIDRALAATRVELAVGVNGASSGVDGARSGVEDASGGSDGASSGADGARSGSDGTSSGADGASSGVDGGAATGARHPVGLPWGPTTESCATCAWFYVGGRGPGVERCRQSAEAGGEGQRTARTHRACARWEPPVDCQTCGACCREAYHSVTVSVRDPVVWKQPALIVRNGHRFEILREGPRCAALADRRQTPIADGPADRAAADRAAAGLADGPTARGRTEASSSTAGERALPLFACRIYEDRPRACRDFEAGGRHCLVARRRVGLSP